MGKEQYYIIQSAIEESHDVRSFRFAFGERRFSFVPGQFILVKLLPSGPQAPLTFSSSPVDPDGFEVTLKRVGDFGTKFFDEASAGDAVSIIGPSGRFNIELEGRDTIAFIGRDYSISAARAYLRWSRDLWVSSSKAPTRKFHLFQEVSAPDQVIYEQELSEHVPGYSRTLILEAENVPPSWRDKVGQLNSAILNLELEDLRKTQFYVCGEGVDVKRWKKVLADLPIPEANLHIDRWS